MKYKRFPRFSLRIPTQGDSLNTATTTATTTTTTTITTTITTITTTITTTIIIITITIITTTTTKIITIITTLFVPAYDCFTELTKVLKEKRISTIHRYELPYIVIAKNARKPGYQKQ